MKKILLLLCLLVTGITSALATDPPAPSTPTSTDSNPNGTPGVIYLGLKDDYEISWIGGFPVTAIFSTMELPYFDDGRLNYAIEHGAQMKYCTNYDFAAKNMKFSVSGVGSTPTENVYFPYNGSASGMITPADGKSKFDLPTSTQTITMYFVIDGSSINRSDGAHAPDYCNTYVLPWKVKFRPYLYSNTLAWSGTKDYVGYKGDVLDLTMKPGLSGSVLSGNNTTTDISTGNDLGNSKMAGTDAPTPSITYNTNGVKIYTAGSYSIGFSQAANAARDYPASGNSEYVHYQYYNRINHNGSLVKTISNKTANVGDVVTVGGTEEFGSSSPTISVTGTSSDRTISGQTVKFDKAGTYTVTVTTHGDASSSPTSSSLFYRPKSYSYTVTVTDTKTPCNLALTKTTDTKTYSDVKAGIDLSAYISGTPHAGVAAVTCTTTNGDYTISGKTLTLKSSATALSNVTVTFTCPAAGVYSEGTKTLTLTVNKDANAINATNQSISVAEAVAGYNFVTGCGVANTNAGNTNAIGYSTIKGTISGNNITGLASGDVATIEATQAPTAFVEGATKTFTITVGAKTSCNFDLTKTSDDVKLSAIKAGVNIASYIKSGSHTATYSYAVTGGSIAGATFSGSTVSAAGATGEGTVIVTVTCPETAEYAGPTTKTLTLNVKYDEYDDPADEPKVATGHTSGETITKKYWEVSGTNSLDLSGYVTGTGITFAALVGSSINVDGTGFTAPYVGNYTVVASKNDGIHAPFSATFYVEVEKNDNDLAVATPSITKPVAEAASGLNIATLAGVTYNTANKGNASAPKYSITGGTATINATTGKATGLAAGGSYTITITQDETATALGGTKTVSLSVGDLAANDLAVVFPSVTKKVSDLASFDIDALYTGGNGETVTPSYSKGGSACAKPTTFGKYTVTYTQPASATVAGKTVSYELILLKDVDPSDPTLPHEVSGADKDVEPGEDIVPTIVTPGNNTKEPTVTATKVPGGTPVIWPYSGGKVVVPGTTDPGEYSVEITYPEDPDNFIPEVTVGPFTIFVDEQPTVTPTGVTPTMKEGDTTLPDFSTAFTSNNTETPTYYVKKGGSWTEITPGVASTLVPGDYEIQVVQPEDHTNHIAGKPLDPSASGDFTLAVVSNSGKPSGEPKEDLTPGDDILDGVNPGDNQKEPIVKIKKIEPTVGPEIIVLVTGTYPDQEADIPGGTEKGKYEVTITYPDDTDNHISGATIGPKTVYVEDPYTFTIDPSKTPVISEVGTEPDFDAPYTSNNTQTPTYYIKNGGTWTEVTPGFVPTLPKGDYEVQVVIPADHTNYIEGKPLDPGATSGDFTLKIADPNPADKVKEEVNLVPQQLPYDPLKNVDPVPTDPTVLAGVTTEIKPKGHPDTEYTVLPGGKIPSTQPDGDYTIRVTIPADPSGPYPEKVIVYDVHIGPEFHYDGDTKQEDIDDIMGEDVDVVMDRTFIAGWNTICLPFTLMDSEIYSVFGSGAQVWEFTRATSDMIMHFTKQEDNVEITAGVPYMIYLPSAVVKPTFNGVTIETSVGQTVTKTDINGDAYKFTGAVTATELGTGNGLRMLSGTSIKKPSSAGTLKASRCYYQFPASAGAKSGMMMFMNFDEATSIDADVTVDESKAQVIYNINGQRVDNMNAPGVYVVNGKKVVKK